MVEVVPDMPEGTLGFRAAGPLTAEDYREVLVPALKAAVDSGNGVRLLGRRHLDRSSILTVLLCQCGSLTI